MSKEETSYDIGLCLEERIMTLHLDIETSKFSNESKCLLKREIEFLFWLLRVNNGENIDEYINRLFEKPIFLENREYIGTKI